MFYRRHTAPITSCSEVKNGHHATVCLSGCKVNPITVYSYGFPLKCTVAGQASDSMMALT